MDVGVLLPTCLGAARAAQMIEEMVFAMTALARDLLPAFGANGA